MIECPHCEGQGGSKDYWGEWCDCECCNPNADEDKGGKVTPERLAEYNGIITTMEEAMTPSEFELMEEKIRTRIEAIDKKFEEADGWGSWMATMSSERQYLCREYRKLGLKIEDRWVLTAAVGARR